MNLPFNYQLCNSRHITTGGLFLHLENMNHSPRVTGRTLVKTTVICTLMSALPTPRNMLFILLVAVLLPPLGLAIAGAQ